MEHTKKLIFDYVQLISDMQEMTDCCGGASFYGIEQRRIALHEEICESMGLDRIGSKVVLSYLENYGFKTDSYNSESDIERVADAVYKALVILRDS